MGFIKKFKDFQNQVKNESLDDIYMASINDIEEDGLSDKQEFEDGLNADQSDDDTSIDTEDNDEELIDDINQIECDIETSDCIEDSDIINHEVGKDVADVIDITVNDDNTIEEPDFTTTSDEFQNQFMQNYGDSVQNNNNWSIVKIMTFDGPKIAVDKSSTKHEIIATNLTYDNAVNQVDELTKSMGMYAFNADKDMIAGKTSQYVLPSANTQSSSYKV